jgi:hypothetical protein
MFGDGANGGERLVAVVAKELVLRHGEPPTAENPSVAMKGGLAPLLSLRFDLK